MIIVVTLQSTEEDEDIIGIAKMGRQAVEIGQMYKKKISVIVNGIDFTALPAIQNNVLVQSFD